MPKKKPSEDLPELSTLPDRLTYARKRANMTKAELAERAEIDPARITRYETGDRVQGIEAATIIRLAKALGVPVGFLAADEVSPGPPAPVFREGNGDRRLKSNRTKSTK